MAAQQPWLFLSIVALSGALLAGCLGNDKVDPRPAVAEDADVGDLDRDGPRPSVEGHVRDRDGQALALAEVAVQNRDEATITNETGYFALFDLEHNEVYVLIAALEGYARVAQQVVAIDDKIVELDFTLEALPEEEPYTDIVDRSGLLSCQIMAGAGGGHGGAGQEVHQGCSGFAGQDPNAVDTLEFSLGAGIVGLVIEVTWDSSQPLSDFLQVHAETIGYGDLDIDLGEVIGPSPLKIEVAQDNVAKFYTDNGGGVRVKAAVHTEDDDEQAAGAAAAFQQSFQVYVSMFFVEPNPPTYTALPS